MPSLDARQSDLSALHPAVREAVANVLADLRAGRHPFEVFEAFRSPERQRHLYAKGRTAPGKKVTKAPAWSSYHQYGLAADFVLKIDGQWSWDDKGANAAHWRALHTIGRKHGLEPLSWELPHLQMAGLSIDDLRRGNYPPFGDDDWADNLEAVIAGWSGDQAAPPPPTVAERPALADEESDQGTAPLALPASTSAPQDDDELVRPATPDAIPETTAMPGQFARIQTYIDKWEGGYVDHPSDPGGATNMGITLATLSRWRQRNVTKADVRALTRSEQRQIMKAFYYDVVRGDELPAPVAALVYNAAVLHGPSRGAKFLQTAVNAQGLSVSVDGAIGQETLAAAGRADVARLVEDYLRTQEAFLRGLKHFPTFGKGWINRLEDIGQFARSLLAAQPMLVEMDDPEEPVVIRGEARQPEIPATQQKPLTPVNDALGETVGKLLNGRKTFLGVAGALIAAVAPGLGAEQLLSAGTVDLATNFLQPASLAMLGWGLLGKVEKWLAQRPAPVPMSRS